MSNDIGFIGVGVMGEPMCRNLALKSGGRILAYDIDPMPLERLAADGVAAAESPAEMCATTHTIILSLPAGEQVSRICLGEDSLLAHLADGQCVIDCGTSPPELARELHQVFAEKGVAFADAPVARTRQAAIDGTLSIMVGGDDDVFARIRPILACMASDVTHCGAAGAGQPMYGSRGVHLARVKQWISRVLLDFAQMWSFAAIRLSRKQAEPQQSGATSSSPECLQRTRGPSPRSARRHSRLILSSRSRLRTAS